MKKVHPLRSDTIRKKLRKLGFKRRAKSPGPHETWVKGAQKVTVPKKRLVRARGTLEDIRKRAGLTKEEFY